MKPTLLVLAAGMGSRYGGLKQLDPVGPSGECVLDYSVFDALRGGFGKIVFVIRHDFETEFRRAIGARFEAQTEVAYAFQELEDLPPGFSLPPGRTKPWGTGHAILAAADGINEPFAVINADDFYGAESFEKLAAFLRLAGSGEDSRPHRYSMVGFPLRKTLSEHGSVSRGVCRLDAAGQLVSIEELTHIETAPDGSIRQVAPDGTARALSADEIVSMNMWGFAPSIFGHLAEKFAQFVRERGQEPKAEFFIPTVVDELITGGAATVAVLRSNASWFGITYREDKPHVVAAIRRLIDAGIYPPQLS